jgi:hypothetical protein
MAPLRFKKNPMGAIKIRAGLKTGAPRREEIQSRLETGSVIDKRNFPDQWSGFFLCKCYYFL